MLPVERLEALTAAAMPSQLPGWDKILGIFEPSPALLVETAENFRVGLARRPHFDETCPARVAVALPFQNDCSLGKPTCTSRAALAQGQGQVRGRRRYKSRNPLTTNDGDARWSALAASSLWRRAIVRAGLSREATRMATTSGTPPPPA